ncbi:MAG: sigma-70 family RNA polymerase sigma factor [Pirellula sp.]
MHPSPTTRASLIVRLHDRRDMQAWEEFVGLYSPLIRRVARSRGLQEADASEVVQDVMVAIVKAIPNYECSTQVGSFRRWLTTIARNKTLNRLTRQPVDVARRCPELVSNNFGDLNWIEAKQCGEQTSVIDSEWRQQIFVLGAQSVRARVQPSTWSAFWMTAVEDRDGDEVAQELGMSIGAVYVARSRVLAKIREWVQNYLMKWENDRDC